MTYHTLRAEDGGKFDISDSIDGTIVGEFENAQDLLSYFSSKYGAKVARTILDTVETCGNCYLPHQECFCNR